MEPMRRPYGGFNAMFGGVSGAEGAASPAVAEGKVYMGSFDNKVYCFSSLPEPIPTLSEWGMIVLGLLLLTVGTIALIKRRKIAAVPD